MICRACGYHTNYCECPKKFKATGVGQPISIKLKTPISIKLKTHLIRCSQCKRYMGNSKNTINGKYIHKKCEKKYLHLQEVKNLKKGIFK